MLRPKVSSPQQKTKKLLDASPPVSPIIKKKKKKTDFEDETDDNLDTRRNQYNVKESHPSKLLLTIQEEDEDEGVVSSVVPTRLSPIIRAATPLTIEDTDTDDIFESALSALTALGVAPTNSVSLIEKISREEVANNVVKEERKAEVVSKPTVHEKRRVYFADDVGQELETVNVFTTDARESPKKSASPTKEIRVKQFAINIPPNKSNVPKNDSPKPRKKVVLKKTKIEAFRFATDRRAEEKKVVPKNEVIPPITPSTQAKRRKYEELTADQNRFSTPPRIELRPNSNLAPIQVPNKIQLGNNSPTNGAPSPQSKAFYVQLRNHLEMSPRSSKEQDNLQKVRVVYIPQDTSKDIYEKSTTTATHQKDFQNWFGGRYRCHAWVIKVASDSGRITHKRMICSKAIAIGIGTAPQPEYNSRIRSYFPTNSFVPKGDAIICSYVSASKPLSITLTNPNSDSNYWLIDYDTDHFRKDLQIKTDNMTFGGINNSDWHSSSSSLFSSSDKPTTTKTIVSITQNNVKLPNNSSSSLPVSPSVTRPTTVSLRSTLSNSNLNSKAPLPSSYPAIVPYSPTASSTQQSNNSSPSRFIVGLQRIGTSNNVTSVPPVKKIHTMRTLGISQVM